MNNDPYRGASQPDRRVINRSGASPSNPAYRAADETQATKDEASVASPRSSGGSRRSERGSSHSGSNKGLLWTVVIALLVLVIGLVGWVVWSNSKNTETGIDSSRYQAVFLSNGQIYFGKLAAFNDESFKITDIYYPQAQATGEEAETDVNSQQSSIQLFPVTEGVHGPEDEMIILKSQILYYENLKADSKVTQLIEQNKK